MVLSGLRQHPALGLVCASHVTCTFCHIAMTVLAIRKAEEDASNCSAFCPMQCSAQRDSQWQEPSY